MPIKQQRRRIRRPEANLFHQETEQSIWDRIPERNRQEARRLMARMFVALIARDCIPADEEDDHE